jgi:hypothetical protein
MIDLLCEEEEMVASNIFRLQLIDLNIGDLVDNDKQSIMLTDRRSMTSMDVILETIA